MSERQIIEVNVHGTIRLDAQPEPPAAVRGGQLTRGRRPEWLRVKAADSPRYRELAGLFRGKSLHTVCEEAMCPNIGECWGRGTATFLLMGDTCTRSCGFCKIKTGRPSLLDPDEPRRVGESVQAMGLHHAVLTSVNRDEQPDGGAWVFAESIRWIRRLQPGCTVRCLSLTSRRLGCAANGDGRAPGNSEPQHGDGAAALSHCATAGEVLAQLGALQRGKTMDRKR